MQNHDTSAEKTPQEAPQVTPTGAPQPQVQYVVTERSLNGLGGWLIFWIIVFSLAGLGYIVGFFSLFDSGFTTGAAVNTAIFSPLLAIGYIGSVVLIAMRKKLGRYVSVATLGLTGVFGAIGTIIASTDSYDSQVAVTVGGILASLVFAGLLSLYFLLSKRVTQTLVR